MRRIDWMGCCVVAWMLGGVAGLSAQTSGTLSENPEIVRLSLVQGDVRLMRGDEGKKASGADWQQAQADIPLETGYSLVTGKVGRAEIELEDASTVYVGENSVVSFNHLMTLGGVPHTELGLVSGSVALHLRPYVAGTSLLLRTQVNGLTMRYPEQTFARVNAYMDAMTITQLGPTGSMRLGNRIRTVATEDTVAYYSGRWSRVGVKLPELDTTDYAGLDKWVTERAQMHDAEMASAMKAAGVDQPLPGLPEIARAGKFFACEFGTCWDSNEAAEAETQAGAEDAGVSSQAGVQAVAMQSGGVAPTRLSNGRPNRLLPGLFSEDVIFPCSPVHWRYWYMRDPVTGKKKPVYTEVLIHGYGYRWGVCHAGSWAPRGHHYMWVVGTKRHHHWPGKWYRHGSEKGFAPIHPRDVAGKPPINLQHPLVPVGGKTGSFGMKPGWGDGKPPLQLDGPPKEFRRASMEPLPKAQEPVAESRAWRAELPVIRVGPGVSTERVSSPSRAAITFDHKSQTFLMARETVRDGHPVALRPEPVGIAVGQQPRVSDTPIYGGGNPMATFNGNAAGTPYSGGSPMSSGGGSTVSAAPVSAPSSTPAPAESGARH